ncbi:NDKM protein, partial [Formicarius rufipectus]|nr:NDKM protein [Formicarius rufipectus]
AAPPELQERTLVLAKPDAVHRQLVGNITQHFERRGFGLVAMKLLQVDQGLVDRHYQELWHKPFYPALVAYTTSGPMWPWGVAALGDSAGSAVPVPQLWEGYSVVRCTRAMVGNTDSVGTIGGDLSVHMSR